MNTVLPGRFRTSITALAILVSTSLVIVPSLVSGFPIEVNKVVNGGTHYESSFVLASGETVSIGFEVTSGPEVGFYFMNESEFTQFQEAWPNVSSISFFPPLSVQSARSIQVSAAVPSAGSFYFVVANANPDPSTIVGMIDTPLQYPSLIIALALMAVIIGSALAVVWVLMLRRTARLRLSQYSPPGRPTPPNLSHQHITAQKPVLQEEGRSTCPNCGAKVMEGTNACGTCGARL